MSKKTRLITFIVVVGLMNVVLIATSVRLLTPNPNDGVLPTLAVLPSLTPSGQVLAAVPTNEVATPLPVVIFETLVPPTDAPVEIPTSTIPAQATPVAITNLPSPIAPIATAAFPTAEPIVIPITNQPVQGQIVIQFTPGTTAEEQAAYVASVGGTISQTIDALDTVVVSVPEAIAAQPLPESPLVETSEPDFLVVALEAPAMNDPLYPQQWALPVMAVPDAWANVPTDAARVAVAVIDSGICAEHPDLSGRILPGRDFVDGDNTPQDDFGHGCSVAGIIAANPGNNVGIVGVAPNTQIMPLRVLNAQGVGKYSDLAAAIVYAADNGAQIINLSLGGPNPSSVLQNAIDYAIGRGAMVIAAAGNTGGSVLYPAAYAPVIAVASVDSTLEHSSFSSYGPEIDLLAPGRDIMTTKRDGSYGPVSGTSFAAPNVAGVAALEMAMGRTLTLGGGVVSVGSVGQVPTVTSIPPTNTPTPTVPTILETATPSSDISTQLREPTQPKGEIGLFEWSPTTNIIAFWQVNELPGSPGFLNFDLILLNVDSGERFVLAEGGEAGPMQFSADSSLLWFWYNSNPFVADSSNGSVRPANEEEMPIESKFTFEPDSDEIALPVVLAVSANLDYKILSEAGELILLNQITNGTQTLTNNAEVHEQRVNAFALAEEENVVAQVAVANAFDFPMCPPNLTGCYDANVYGQAHPGADYNGNANTVWGDCRNRGDCDRFWPVNAVANGRVVYSNYVGGNFDWGNIIMIEHTLPDGSKVWSQYAHLEDRWVSETAEVTRGQQIGRVGKGHNNQFAAHLHFEMRTQFFAASAWQFGGTNWQSYYTNPTNYINSHRQIGNPTDCSNYSFNGVVLFINAQCQGSTVEFSNPGFRKLTDSNFNFNDLTSSIHVAPNWSIRIWADDNDASPTTCITQSKWDLSVDRYDNNGPIINNTITWIQVFNNGNCSGDGNNGPVVLYRDPNLTGDACYLTGVGSGVICNGFNDQISSIRVRNGWSARVWADTINNGPAGPSRCFTTYTPNLTGIQYNENGNGNVDDSISFFAAYNQSSCPPLVTPPSAPTLNSPPNGATFNSLANITLSWNTSAGASEYHGEFWGGPNTNIATFNTSGTSWAFAQVRGGTYQWHVKARNSAGESGWSETRTLTVGYVAPSGLSATAVSESQINLSWSASVDGPDNIDGYRIFRDGSPIGIVGGNTTSYSDSGLSCAAEYHYTVRAFKGSVESGDSNQVSRTTNTCPTTGLTAPILNSPANGATVDRFENITLSWNAPSGATQYYGEVWSDALGGTVPTFVWINNTAWTIGQNPGGTYQWHIMARNDGGESPWSETWTFTIEYGAPSGLSASTISSRQINLSWTSSVDAPANIDGYRIYRNGSQVGTTNRSTTSFSDTGLSCNTSYSYAVRAFKGSVESDSSNNVLQTTASCPPPGTGTGLTGEYYDNADLTGFVTSQVDPEINFFWNDVDINGDVFSMRWTGQVQPLYSETYTFFTNIDDGARLWVNNQLLIDRWINQPGLASASIALIAGQRYDIKLEYTLNNGSGQIWLGWESPSQAQETIPQSQLYPYINPPTDLTATAVSASQINLSWTDVSTNETSFRVERSPNGNTNWTEIAQLAANTTSYQNVNLAAGTTYYYRVRAYLSTGSRYSAFSNRASAATSVVPVPPTLLDPGDGSALGSRDVTFSWQSPGLPGQTGYGFRLNQSPNPQATPVLVDTGLGNGTLSYNYIFANDGTYYWHMQTTTSGGNSAWVTRSLKVDTTAPSVYIGTPVENGYIRANQVAFQAFPSDSLSGICAVQFFVGYDPVLSTSAVGSLSQLEVTPPPAASPSVIEQVNDLDITAQAWDWTQIYWDTNGIDGWGTSWDASSVADQNIAFFVYAYDCAWNYQGTGVGNILLDRTAPTSSVTALPSTSQTSFVVEWAGSDNLSGIASYDVQYQDNGGTWTNWQTNVTTTSATFNGVSGHSYGFRSRARDIAGNVEAWPSTADTQTTVVVMLAPPIMLQPDEGMALANRTVSFTWQYPSASGQTGYTLRLSQSIDPDLSPWLVNTTLGNSTLSYTFTFAGDGTYYWHMRTNTSSGNSVWSTRTILIDTVMPSVTISTPIDSSFLNTNQIIVQASASDSLSRICAVQFFAGYDANLSAASLSVADTTSQSWLASPPAATSLEAAGQANTSDLAAQGWGWHEIYWDTNGDDGWGTTWDASGTADQIISFFAYAYDCAWNYAGTSVDNIRLDRTAPTSAVNNLPLSSSATFTVSWSGSDATAGIAVYDVEYQENGGGWISWQTNVTSTSATFTGNVGSTYEFRSRATDQAGNVEDWPGTPDTVTTIIGGIPNDFIEGALVVPSLPFTHTQDINGSTVSPDDPAMCIYDRSNTVWFSYTPSTTQTLNLNTEGSDNYDTVIAVYTGVGVPLPMIACDDDSGSELRSSLNFTASAGTTYYIMVAHYGSQPVSGPNILTFSVFPATPPPPPILVAPASATLTNNSNPLLIWNLATNANSYRVQIDNNSNFSSPVQDTTTSDTFYISDTLADGRYYWRVRGLNGLGIPGAWSSVRYFTVDTLAPVAPILTAPRDGLTVTTNRPVFSWGASTGATRYEVQLDTVNPPAAVVSNSAARSFTPPSALLLTTYYWRVRAIDAAGNVSSWSDIRTVTVTSAPNTAPPRNRFQTSTPTLSWGAVTWATGYEIQVDNNSNFTSPEYSSGLLPAGTGSHTTEPLADGTYYWRARARRADGTWGPWSAPDSFVVDAP